MATREELVRAANAARTAATPDLPKGFRMIVVVTDEEGDWCGVSSALEPEETAGLLRAALDGADLVWHPGEEE